MTKIRIAVVIDQLLPGGVQKAAIDEVRWLNKLGHNTKLIILMRKGFEKKILRSMNNIPYEFLSDRYPSIFQKSLKLPFFTFLSTMHLASPVLASVKVNTKEFDIIVSHGTTTSLTTWALAKFRKIPYLAVIHDPMVYILDKVYSETTLRFFFPVLKPLAAFLEANFTKSARVCLVDSSVHAKYLQQKYGMKPVVLYLGINPPKQLPKTRGDAILAFGRWDVGKNPKILLKLIGNLPKINLVIAGSWTDQKDLENFKKEIKDRKLQERVKIIPHYSESELPQIAAQGRVWVHPHFEAFSLSALEAASLGLPIVIPEKSGITEIFEDSVHGFFPKQITVQNLKRTLLPFLENERLAFQMGQEASQVAQKYTHRQRAIKLLKLIETTLNKPHEIIALETGHITGSLVAGGDRLLEEMVKRIKTHFKLTVIVPKEGVNHWQQSGLDITLKVLPDNPFQKATGPFGVFANYLVRIWQSTLTLRLSIRQNKNKKNLLYSSTNIWPDVIPAFLIKFTNPQIYWVARVHHLLTSPFKRPGHLWVNLGSNVLEKLALWTIKNKAELILVLNSGLKNDLVRQGFSGEKLVVLGGGVDFKKISEIPVKHKRGFDGVFLGRLHPAKGVFDLIPIWQEVVNYNPDAKLAIVGTGSSETAINLQKKINTSNLTNHIKLLGFLPQQKVWQLLKASKVFLFTDHEAGFGLACAEAMAAGLPVIGWNIGVLGSVFTKGFIKVPLNDYQQFSKRIVFLLKHDNYRAALANEARSEAAKFEWTKTAVEFENLLKSII